MRLKGATASAWLAKAGVRSPKAQREKVPVVDLADTLAFQLSAHGIDGWVREHRFHLERKWRLDIAFVSRKLGIECEGFGRGGAGGYHQSPKSLPGECEKHSELAIAGWRLIRCTGKQIKSGNALVWIERALA